MNHYGPLCFIKSNISTVYQEVLEHPMHPFADKKYSLISFSSNTQPKIPISASVDMISLFLIGQQFGSDLNHTENLYSFDKKKARDTSPKNTDEWKDTISATWASLILQQSHRLITHWCSDSRKKSPDKIFIAHTSQYIDTLFNRPTLHFV